MVYTVDGQPVQVVVIGLLSQLLHAYHNVHGETCLYVLYS